MHYFKRFVVCYEPKKNKVPKSSRLLILLEFLYQKKSFSNSTTVKGKINGILLSKLFRPTVRKNCSSDRVKLLKFQAEGREFAKFLRSLEQFIQTVKGQNNFW